MTFGRVGRERIVAALWGVVFPLGMYTVCTFRLASVTDLTFLATIPRMFVFIALGAWLLTSIGLVREVTRSALVHEQHH